MNKKYLISHITNVRMILKKIFFVKISVIIFILSFQSIIFAEIQYKGYGANEIVSGSLHVLNIDGDKIILDSGLFYGDDEAKLTSIKEEELKEELKDASAIIVSHAHLDHIGRLIKIIKKLGYNGSIFCSSPTRELMPVMLLLAARYEDLGQETFYYSKRSLKENRKKGKNTAAHLYRCSWGTKILSRNVRYIDCSRKELAEKGFYLCKDCAQKDVDEVMQHVEVIPLHKPTKVSKYLTVEFYNTPHLPGSVMMLIKSSLSGDSVIYSGDFGSGLSPYLSSQEYIDSGKLAIIEGTYGTNIYKRNPDDRIVFRKYIGDCIKLGRRVIIPAFALDRSQQVLGEISKGMNSGFIPKNTKVTVFSPTIAKFNEIYSSIFTKPLYLEYFSPEFIKDGPFDNTVFKEKTSIKEILDIHHGEIAVATSGMADFVYSKDFIKKWIEDPNTVFVFVSYQDPESIGGILTSATSPSGTIKIDEKIYKIKGEIKKFDCFAGHGDFRQISEFIRKIKNLNTVLLVHLETKNTEVLKETYEKMFPNINFIVPKTEETYSFVFDADKFILDPLTNH